MFIEYESKAPSKSKGTRVDGSLMNGKRLPTSGPNFETYSRLLSTVGRTCVHEKVRAAVVTAYALIYERDPELRFAYGGPHGTLQAIRDTLLPKLISGELRVPDAERLVSEVV